MKKERAVWVDESKCKACKICVALCPSGSLAMKIDIHSISGSMIEVIEAASCIGCRACELQCPDFAIFVADKAYNFAKLSQEAKARAAAIKKNNFFKLGE